MRINNRNRFYCVILAFVVWQTLLMVSNAAWGDGRIDNISLKRVGNYTQVTIYGDEPFEFSHSIEGAKDGKPHRVIMDCQNMIFDLPQHDFKEGLPEGIIRTIRTSQFQTVPEKIVRVVLDLKSTATYKVMETGSEKRVTIAILTTQEPDFTAWLAVKETRKENEVDATIKTETVKAETENMKMPTKKEEKSAWVTTAGTAPQPIATTPDNQAEIPKAKSLATLIVTEKSTKEKVQKEKTYYKTVSYADTGETILFQKEKPVLASLVKTSNETKEDAKKQEREKTDIKTSTLTLPESKTPGMVSLKPNQQPIETASPGTDVKSTEVHPASEDILSSKGIISQVPAKTKTAEDQPTVFSPSAAGNVPGPSSPRTISRTAVHLGPYPEEKTYAEVPAEKSKTSITQTETEKNQTVVTDIGSSVKKGIGAVLGTKGVSAHEADSLTQVLTGIPNSFQVDLGSVPSRRMITYNPESRRDPFLPLTEKEDMQFGEVPLPQFENLKLVGIIKDNRGNEALLEDEIGFGYILRSGDRIKNGYVMSVEDYKIIFHVEDYGGYKIMTLELNPEY